MTRARRRRRDEGTAVAIRFGVEALHLHGIMLFPRAAVPPPSHRRPTSATPPPPPPQFLLQTVAELMARRPHHATTAPTRRAESLPASWGARDADALWRSHSLPEGCGTAKWHPGKLHHAATGAALALLHLDALSAALRVGANGDDASAARRRSLSADGGAAMDRAARPVASDDGDGSSAGRAHALALGIEDDRPRSLPGRLACPAKPVPSTLDEWDVAGCATVMTPRGDAARAHLESLVASWAAPDGDGDGSGEGEGEGNGDAYDPHDAAACPRWHGEPHLLACVRDAWPPAAWRLALMPDDVHSVLRFTQGFLIRWQIT